MRRASSLPDRVHIASTLDDAIGRCNSLAQHERVETLYVIGGSQVYAEALESPHTTTVYLTRVDVEAACDTFIPEVSKERFVLKNRSATCEEHGIKYNFETYSALQQADPAPAHAGVSSLSSLAREQWSASRGRAVFATQDIDAGAILWREPPVAAIQYAESRQSGMMACRDSLRFVGTLESQLQVLGHFTESEQAAGTANIEPALAELMAQSKAAARCTGTFELQAIDHGNEELFADANARERAFAAYNRWLNADPAAWGAFQEHALSTNETFVLAAQLLARYFCSEADTAARRYANSGQTLDEQACCVRGRSPVDVLEGLISELWWELPSASASAAESGQLQHDQEYEEEEESALDIATSRRVLLQESYQHLAAVTRAAGSDVTIEMYSRLVGALELNSISVEVQSPVAAFVDELLEHLGLEDDTVPGSAPLSSLMGSASDSAVVDKGRKAEVEEGKAAAATTSAGLREEDVDRAACLILPHIERRLEMFAAANSHDDSTDDTETQTEPAEKLARAPSESQPKSSAGTTASAASPPALKRQRLHASPSDDEAATRQSASTVPPAVRLREIFAELGSVDQLYPPLCGVGLYDGVAKLNHDCAPNAVVVFEQDAIATVAALRSIRKGEEICISYIEVNQSADDRRADLLDYGFVCSCRRCVQELEMETERTR